MITYFSTSTPNGKRRRESIKKQQRDKHNKAPEQILIALRYPCKERTTYLHRIKRIARESRKWEDMEGNKGVAPSRIGDSGGAASRGQSFATSGGAFVVPPTTGNQNLSQANQTLSTVMNPGVGQVEPSQVGGGQLTTAQYPPESVPMAQDSSATMVGTSQNQHSDETQQNLGATESEVAKEDDATKKPKKDRSKLRKGKWTVRCPTKSFINNTSFALYSYNHLLAYVVHSRRKKSTLLESFTISAQVSSLYRKELRFVPTWRKS